MTIGDVVCILLSVFGALALLVYLIQRDKASARRRRQEIDENLCRVVAALEHEELGPPESAPFSAYIKDESVLSTLDDMRFRPYVGDDVQGFHAGQRAADVDSNEDRWSRDVDAFARETMEALEKKHPMPPGPASCHEDNQEEYERWFADQRRIQALVDAEFAAAMAEKYPPREHLS
jgi:hypothetical protein